jgi:hypothetical protein
MTPGVPMPSRYCREGSASVTQDPKIQEFVMKAIESEGWAAIVLDPSIKREWLRISQAYYDLAESMVRNAAKAACWEPASPPPSAPA